MSTSKNGVRGFNGGTDLLVKVISKIFAKARTIVNENAMRERWGKRNENPTEQFEVLNFHMMSVGGLLGQKLKKRGQGRITP